MIFLFVFFKSVLFSIENVSLDSTDKAERIFIFLQTLLLLSDLSEFIHNDGSNNLVHDDFNDEEIGEIH